MNLDISGILNNWEFVPGQLSVRKIRGLDGGEKIQMRLDLGLLQMETDGRPDGQRPYGHESLLDYYESELHKHRHRFGTDEGFTLDEEACEALRAEGLMYYHRYLAGFVLEEFEMVQRDTERNLRLFDFCHRYAEDEADRHLLEQYRPYVVMMNARARAQAALANDRPKTALAIVKRALRTIREFYARYEEEDELVACSSELAVLHGLRKEIQARLPVDPARKLRQQLHVALREERYEEAAVLRDKLRTMSRNRRGPLTSDS